MDKSVENFGHWLAGFTDGEGNFNASVHYKRKTIFSPVFSFSIRLRADEAEVIYQIQKFLECGNVTYNKNEYGNSHPAVTFRVSDVKSLHDIIIPFFEMFPLRAKKKGDFVIWKRAINLAYQVQNKDKKFWIKNGKGLQKWNPVEIGMLTEYGNQLKENRKFEQLWKVR